MDTATTPKKTRKSSRQFGLRTLLIAMAIVASLVAYGAHFWRMTARAQSHRAEAERLLQSGKFSLIDFHELRLKVATIHWRRAKAIDYLAARWSPWLQIDDASDPTAVDNEPTYLDHIFR